MGHFLPFNPANNLKNQNFEKMKKSSGAIIILTCVPKIMITWVPHLKIMIKKHQKHSIYAICQSTSLKELLKKTFEPTKEIPNIEVNL